MHVRKVAFELSLEVLLDSLKFLLKNLKKTLVVFSVNTIPLFVVLLHERQIDLQFVRMKSLDYGYDGKVDGVSVLLLLLTRGV